MSWWKRRSHGARISDDQVMGLVARDRAAIAAVLDRELRTQAGRPPTKDRSPARFTPCWVAGRPRKKGLLKRGGVAIDTGTWRPASPRSEGIDWKTSLQELTAAEMLGVPGYQVKDSLGQPKFFHAVVWIAGKQMGTGEGRSKEAAEQQAAEAAWRAITVASAVGHRPARPDLDRREP